MPLGRRTPFHVRLLRVRQLAPVPARQWTVVSWMLAVLVKAWALPCPVTPRRGPLLAFQVMLQRWQPQRVSCRGKGVLLI
jgi:hypothetical protein